MNEIKIYPIGKIENKEESGDFDWESEFNF